MADAAGRPAGRSRWVTPGKGSRAAGQGSGHKRPPGLSISFKKSRVPFQDTIISTRVIYQHTGVHVTPVRMPADLGISNAHRKRKPPVRDPVQMQPTAAGLSHNCRHSVWNVSPSRELTRVSLPVTALGDLPSDGHDTLT